MKLASRLLLAEDKAKKKFQKVTLKMLLASGEAKNNTVIGPLLGQYQINIISFCKDFNLKSSEVYEDGVLLSVLVNLNKDKTYVLGIGIPPCNFLLKEILNENNRVEICNLYDLMKIMSYFLKKEEKSMSIMLFGFLNSFNKNVEIIFK